MPSAPHYTWQYIPLVFQILVALGLAGGMVAGSFFIGKHKRSLTKLGAYECGMDPVGRCARAVFPCAFYMVAMLFILFDVEAVFMLPWGGDLPPATRHYRQPFFRLLGDVCVHRLRCGRALSYVWKKGVLNWTNDRADL